jgi:putative ABC transport system permease protein
MDVGLAAYHPCPPHARPPCAFRRHDHDTSTHGHTDCPPRLTAEHPAFCIDHAGVIIEVAAVIAILAIGQGAQAVIRAQIASLGSHAFVIQPGAMTQSGVQYGWGSRTTLRVPDVQAILNECLAVAYATPLVRGGDFQVVYTNQNWPTTVQGTGVEYLTIREWAVAAGEWFTSQEVDAASTVAVLEETVRAKLFGSVDPVGQIIQVGTVPFRVMGVLEAKGQSAWGQDQDDIILIPYTTMQKKVWKWTGISAILAAAGSNTELPQAIEQVTALLRQRHRLQPWQENDFSIQPLADMAAAEEESTRVMPLLLGSIASISLLVGGIGIMNIMLVSVTERTREIGIRLAVGAKQKDILWQFLVEALTLSLSGGVVGVVLGLAGSQLVSTTVGWPLLINWSAIALAVAFSGAVGIFFGFYPARKVAQLDPIQALRYE